MALRLIHYGGTDSYFKRVTTHTETFLLQVLPSGKLRVKVMVTINPMNPLPKSRFLVLALYNNN